MEKKTSHFNTSLNKARNICSKQEKCVVDIQKKLSEWGVNSSDTKIIIEKLKEKSKHVEWNNSERKEYFCIVAKKIEDKKRFRATGCMVFDIDDL